MNHYLIDPPSDPNLFQSNLGDFKVEVRKLKTEHLAADKQSRSTFVFTLEKDGKQHQLEFRFHEFDSGKCIFSELGWHCDFTPAKFEN